MSIPRLLLTVDGVCFFSGLDETPETIFQFSTVWATGSKDSGEYSSLPFMTIFAETIQSRELLASEMKFTGKRIVIIGGGITGLETAIYLKTLGNDVTVVDFAPMLPMSPCPGFMYEAKFDTRHCMELNVELLYEHKVLRYEEGKLIVEAICDGEKKSLETDLIVFSAGAKPDNELYTALIEAGVENVSCGGDVLKPSKVFKAVEQGSK